MFGKHLRRKHKINNIKYEEKSFHMWVHVCDMQWSQLQRSQGDSQACQGRAQDVSAKKVVHQCKICSQKVLWTFPLLQAHIKKKHKDIKDQEHYYTKYFIDEVESTFDRSAEISGEHGLILRQYYNSLFLRNETQDKEAAIGWQAKANDELKSWASRCALANPATILKPNAIRYFAITSGPVV